MLLNAIGCVFKVPAGYAEKQVHAVASTAAAIFAATLIAEP